MSARILDPQPLTAAGFHAFGDVIETDGPAQPINSGTTQHFADLARISTDGEGNRVRAGIYRVAPYPLPLAILMLERHPLGSQLFMPLHDEPFLIVVAPAGDRVDPSDVRAFTTNGRQGINYHAGSWHHPVIALRDPSEFLVIDRAGPERNCDERRFERDQLLLMAPAAIVKR